MNKQKTEYILNIKKNILKFKPNKEQIKVTGEVFFYMAKVETLKPIITEIQKKVLLQNKFKVDKENRTNEKDLIIKDIKNDWLMNDKDFDKYIFLCYEEYIKQGLNAESDALYIKNKDSQKDLKYYTYCPLLIAEDQKRKAERKLIISFESVTGFKLSEVTHNLKVYKEYIELTLKLMAKYVNTKEVLKGGF